MKLPGFIYRCSAMLRSGSARNPMSPHGRTIQGGYGSFKSRLFMFQPVPQIFSSTSILMVLVGIVGIEHVHLHDHQGPLTVLIGKVGNEHAHLDPLTILIGKVGNKHAHKYPLTVLIGKVESKHAH